MVSRRRIQTQGQGVRGGVQQYGRSTLRICKAAYGTFFCSFLFRSNSIHLQSDGTAPTSFVTSSLEEENKLSADDIWDIKHTAASLYGGMSPIYLPVSSNSYRDNVVAAGADTTVSQQHAFFLAMILHPGRLHYRLRNMVALTYFLRRSEKGPNRDRYGYRARPTSYPR